MDEGATIRAFARTRFLALAEELAADLRTRPSTDIYGDDIGAKSLWDEYCYERRNGPTLELLDAWSSILDPLAADLIDRTSHEEAVLLTIAEEWQNGVDDPDDSESEPYSNPDLIAQAVLQQLHSLAKNNNWDGHEPDDECYTCWDEEPYCVLPLGESNRRPLFATPRRLWAAIRNF